MFPVTARMFPVMAEGPADFAWHSATVAHLPIEVWWIGSFMFGALWGSFFNVAIYRWPRGMSVVKPASRCTSCGTPIPAWRNMPIVGWLILKGKTACCGQRLSPRYMIVEISGGVLALSAAMRFGLSDLERPLTEGLLETVLYFAFFGGLLVASFIDAEWMHIPDEITLPLAALGLATAALRLMPGVEAAALGAGLGFFIIQIPFVWLYFHMFGRHGMGEGDSRILLMIGAFVGWRGVLFCLAAGAVQGILVYIGLKVAGKNHTPASALAPMHGDELSNFEPPPSIAVAYRTVDGADSAVDDAAQIDVGDRLKLRLHRGELEVEAKAIDTPEHAAGDAPLHPASPLGLFWRWRRLSTRSMVNRSSTGICRFSRRADEGAREARQQLSDSALKKISKQSVHITKFAKSQANSRCAVILSCQTKFKDKSARSIIIPILYIQKHNLCAVILSCQTSLKTSQRDRLLYRYYIYKSIIYVIY